jgi:tetratricopeptide (TPR) repeat protein
VNSIYKAAVTLTITAAVVLLNSATAAVEQGHPQPVRDLRYGEALYDFYQDQYFRAITDIMVAQARSPISKQGKEPDLLLGSLYLSYGMHEEASGIFQRLSQTNSDAYAHDLAWFYMGRMRYMDGQYEKSLDAFRAIQEALPESKDAERLHLMVNSYLHEGHYKEAIEVLSNNKGQGIWNDYAKYNLGVALIRSNHVKEGIGLLDQLGRILPKNEEEYTLRDKANITLGYTAIRTDVQRDPITPFSRVRLNGPYSNQALLGIGWAYSEKKQPQEALKPWMELSTRSKVDTASQQALIAIAYTLEGLKQRKLALSYYERAVADYDRVHAELDNAINDVDYGEVLRNSIPTSSAADGQWLDTGLQFKTLPAAEYLKELLTSRDFRKAYRDYRDLNYIRLQVDKWRGKIPLLRTMLEERRRQYTINLAHVKDSHYAEHLADLNDKRDVLAREITEIEKHGKIQQLATSEEWTRLKQFQTIKARLAALEAHGLDVKAASTEYRILYGLTQWKLHTEFPIRLWSTKKDLHELDKALAQSAQAQSSLHNVLKISPLNFDAFANRITALEHYINDISVKLNGATQRQEQYCRRLIIDTLTHKRDQVEVYKNRALYAQGRLYDQLSHEADAP